MIFELSHENIRVALQEYMDKRNITQGKQFNFYIKTSRKGTKTSRAVIETLEDTGSLSFTGQLIYPPGVRAVECTVQMEEIVLDIKTLELVKTDFVEDQVEEVTEVESEEGTKTKPFKKLFQ